MSPEQSAYNARSRRVAWPLRIGGLALILLGAVVLIAWKADAALRPMGYALLGLGWGLFGYAAWVRRRWAKAHPFEGERG